jgi:serine protease Do
MSLIKILRVHCYWWVIIIFISIVSEGLSAGKKEGFENLLNAVVRIDVLETTFTAGAKRSIRGVGSGVIMSVDGHILTNAHVVSNNAEDISVTLSNLERLKARLIGWDHWTDLALLQLDLDELKRRQLHLSIATFGDSQSLYTGQTVFAVGTPNGLSRTVTRGIISNTDRYFEGTDLIHGYETGYFNTWLQTDAAINPGNSGGPLVTEKGKVIGINTRSYLGANNLGFAVPATIAEYVMRGLLRDGKVTRSYIGLIPGPLQDLESFYDIEVNIGMLVNSIDPGSPASKANLRPGDIVLSIDEEKVDGRFPEQLPPIRNKISSYPVGSKIQLEIKRTSGIRKVTVETEALESRIGELWAFDDWGLSVEKVTRAVARELKLSSGNGVRVIGIQPAFPAENTGLRRGDIISTVNRQPIESLQMLKDIYKGYEKSPDKILLEIWRHRKILYFVLKP